MPELRLRELHPHEYNKWDDFVDASQQGTIFHKSFWLDVCAQTLNKIPRIYSCFDGDRFVAGCALFVTPSRTRLYNLAGSTAGMSPYGGLALAQSETKSVRRNEQTFNDVIKALTENLDDQGFQWVRLVNPPSFIDVRPFLSNGWYPKICYTYYLDLNEDLERKFSKWTRRTARIAMKDHVTVRRLATPDSKMYSRLFSMTFRKQNLEPPVPAEFFDAMFQRLASQLAGEMWIAEMPDGEVASAEIIVWDKRRPYRWSAASNPEFKETGATTLMLSEIFRSLKQRNFTEIDLMAATVPNLAKFIAGFNPTLIPYYLVERKTWLARNVLTAYSNVSGQLRVWRKGSQT
jgi:hypothetical protein